ncbi:hypothetical protein [Methylobacterium dankookense]|uniref:Uncharacterized protein n=1 Tax=Methylobacterium dankookense TaxID=560405 RepID=A0A564FV73_9HYPH|nr:hypothetical protein [Methylobacterium dankookense]GJD54985.1 hypothetical protein IFDJLNFL_0866 [Methylobacterium dankookense]VUF11983.1 hypothetical protein MTDSW087_01670 [Methylobacterium dankookense]
MTAPLTTALTAERQSAPTGPSFAAALCGFLSTTVATTALMFLLSSV